MNWLKNWDRIEPIDAWFKKIVPSNARRQHLIIELLDSFEMLDRGDVWAIGGLYTFAPLSDDAFDAFRGYLLLTQDDFGAILSASNPEIPLVDSDWLWLGESVNSLLILDTKKFILRNSIFLDGIGRTLASITCRRSYLRSGRVLGIGISLDKRE